MGTELEEVPIDAAQSGSHYRAVVNLEVVYETLRAMIDVATTKRGGIAPGMISVLLP